MKMPDSKSGVIGLDYGTDSVRARSVCAADGAEIAGDVFNYPRWKQELYCNPAANRFRQHPLDYIDGLDVSIRGATAPALAPGAAWGKIPLHHAGDGGRAQYAHPGSRLRTGLRPGLCDGRCCCRAQSRHGRRPAGDGQRFRDCLYCGPCECGEIPGPLPPLPKNLPFYQRGIRRKNRREGAAPEPGTALPCGLRTFMGFHCGNVSSACLVQAKMKYQFIMHRLQEPGQEPNLTRGTIEGQIKAGEVTIFRLQSTAGTERNPISPRARCSMSIRALSAASASLRFRRWAAFTAMSSSKIATPTTQRSPLPMPARPFSPRLACLASGISPLTSSGGLLSYGKSLCLRAGRMHNKEK